MPFISHTPPPKRCNSREHKPPGHIVLQPGDHVWQCPDCGETTVVHIPEPQQWMIQQGSNSERTYLSLTDKTDAWDWRRGQAMCSQTGE